MRSSHARARRPDRNIRHHRLRFKGDRAAVSDVVGSLLLVGITVTMMTGLSLVVLNVPAPQEQVHLRLDIRLHPGPDGEWGTGVEQIRVKHMGGDRLPVERVLVHLLIDDQGETLEGDDIDFENDVLSIGGQWILTKTLSQGQRVAIDMIHKGDPQQIVGSADQRVPVKDAGGSPP